MTKKPEGIELLADPRLTAVGLLFEVAQAVEQQLAPQIAEYGISGVEAGVAIRLARSPENRLRMSDLATQADLSASGLTRVIDRLYTGLLDDDQRAALLGALRIVRDTVRPGAIAGADGAALFGTDAAATE